jgi:hypothetical protein
MKLLIARAILGTYLVAVCLASGWFLYGAFESEPLVMTAITVGLAILLSTIWAVTVVSDGK